ncbi:hypothetical protein QVD17_16363 [Tagetes erecta]|uniref:Uncharacterized protein n=1 Tax=Tagetes erecta TaxID=13708 RepID=A0AAD8KV14_TARER|nr:hypothetical protein QVD17_16363 [Tagetes erecta]
MNSDGDEEIKRSAPTPVTTTNSSDFLVTPVTTTISGKFPATPIGVGCGDRSRQKFTGDGGDRSRRKFAGVGGGDRSRWW